MNLLWFHMIIVMSTFALKMMTVSSMTLYVCVTYLDYLHTVVQMGFAMHKVNISENSQLISILVNKIGDTVLTIKVNLTRAYNTTGKSYKLK